MVLSFPASLLAVATVGERVWRDLTGPTEANPCGWNHPDTVEAWVAIGAGAAAAAIAAYARGRSWRATVIAMLIAGGLLTLIALGMAYEDSLPSAPC